VENDLKQTIESLVDYLFGPVEKRWDHNVKFPFTHPSFELEILYSGKWLEVLGSGCIQLQILDECNKRDCVGWAFGIGLERLAMVLFDVPDIRLFWSNDERFLKQFNRINSAQMNPKNIEQFKFKLFSKYSAVSKDITFYIKSNDAHSVTDRFVHWNENDLSAIVRDVAGDLVESVTCVDSFFNKKLQKTSKCYRILYNSLERQLTNEEVDQMQFKIREQCQQLLPIDLR